MKNAIMTLGPEKTFLKWFTKGREYECQILPNKCEKCGKTGTLVGLPPPVLAIQPDATNVVCLPHLDGCNWGYRMEVDAACLSRRMK